MSLMLLCIINLLTFFVGSSAVVLAVILFQIPLTAAPAPAPALAQVLGAATAPIGMVDQFFLMILI